MTHRTGVLNASGRAVHAAEYRLTSLGHGAAGKTGNAADMLLVVSVNGTAEVKTNRQQYPLHHFRVWCCSTNSPAVKT